MYWPAFDVSIQNLANSMTFRIIQQITFYDWIRRFHPRFQHRGNHMSLHCLFWWQFFPPQAPINFPAWYINCSNTSSFLASFYLPSYTLNITWISQFGISHYIKKKQRKKIISFQTDTNVHFNIAKMHRINSNWWFQHTLAIFLCNMHEPARSPLWLEQTPTDRPASAIRE